MSKKIIIATLVLACIMGSMLAIVGCSKVVSEGNLAKNLVVTDGLGQGTQSEAISMIDGKTDTKWTGDASADNASISATFVFPTTTKFNKIVFDSEHISGFNIYVSYKGSDTWIKIASGNYLNDLEEPGVVVFEEVSADRIKIEITDSDGKFFIREMGIYYEEKDEQKTDTKD